MSNKKPTITLPSMLSFERKLETSDGLMFAGNWEDIGKDNTVKEVKRINGKEIESTEHIWNHISIGDPRKNRGTKSMYSIMDKDIEKVEPNVAEGDDANLPMDKDTLKVSFSLRLVGSLGAPFACNKPDFADAIQAKVKEFKASDEIDDLAFRYAYNIANGRFLWRNRVGAEEVEIQITIHGEETPLTFNAYDFSLKDFEKNKENEKLATLTAAIKKGLVGDEENNFAFMNVDAFVKLGNGQHVFPSQEMNMGEKKKKLFHLGGCAAMHNVKIGNAIRTVDTWYGTQMMIKAEGKRKTETVDVDIRLPIAAEPYGSVTQHGRAYRPSKNDFYTLMKSWLNEVDIEADQRKYVVANLIRGGVFGGDSEA